MALKAVTYQFKGMNRDLSNINANEQFAYEIRNMRITPNEDNTLLSITSIHNHKDLNIELAGIPIGQAVIDNEWIIFCSGEKSWHKEEAPMSISDLDVNTEQLNDYLAEQQSIVNPRYDYIYKITKSDNSYSVDYVYGKFEFSTQSPIETLTYVENDNLKKVYWTDGKNQFRFINICNIKDNKYIKAETLNAVTSIKDSTETLQIIKKDTTGIFPAGTVQYAFTYVNYYGQQSNIFKISSLYYNSGSQSGLSTEKTSVNSYEIILENLDNNYQYVRIYSIVRSSPNSVPAVKVVNDVEISDNSIEYLDRNTSGYTIDPMDLFYVGGEQLIVQSLAAKDNTLFLGNVTKIVPTITSDINNKLFNKYNNEITFFEDDNKVFKEEAKGFYYEKKFQLKKPSSEVTTFKCGDYYRFGVQFQHNSGKWSDVVWLGDKQNSMFPKTTLYEEDGYHTHKLISAKCTISDNEVVNSLKDLGFVKARPVIVYPDFSSRQVICQGYVSPTVYNAGDRINKTSWAQSSWFARPYIKDRYYPQWDNSDEWKHGAQLEFRHNAYLGAFTAHSEIQGSDRSPYDTYEGTDGMSFLINKENGFTLDTWKEEHSHQFFVDTSMITLHSPELEFDDSLKNLPLQDYKFRIIGFVPLSGFQGDIDLITSTVSYGNFLLENSEDEEDSEGIIRTNKGWQQQGFYKKDTSSYNYSVYGSRILCSGIFYRDMYNYKEYDGKFPIFDTVSESEYNEDYIKVGEKILKYKEYKNHLVQFRKIGAMGFHIFPFHCSGDIYEVGGSENQYNTLQYKKLSNVRYSYGNQYYKNAIQAEINDMQMFYNQNEIPIRVKNFSNEDVFYHGNVDKLLIPMCLKTYGEGKVQFGSRRYESPQLGWESNLLGAINPICYKLNIESANKIPPTYNFGSVQNDPIVMRYKSTPHCVVSLKGSETTQYILPVYNNTNTKALEIYENDTAFWEFGNKKLEDQTPIQNLTGDTNKFNGLFLAEIYQETDPDTLFGGNTQTSVAFNTWNIAGEDVVLNDSITLKYTEGDTYYQRYDNLKTYPNSLEEVNGITDVISFMVETRINLEGRYDKNISNKAHFHIFPDNYNLINFGYTQSNNYFNYFSYDQNRVQTSKYSNLITWSKTKVSGELIDTWLNFNLASTLELDGNYGKINALHNNNGNLIAFQDNAISHILYNEQTQISTDKGVPIEISNSGKVTGSRLYSNSIGCTNKWSIKQTDNGVYFVNSYDKDIYILNDSLKNLSLGLGMSSYIRSIPDIQKQWNALDFTGIKTEYDPINKEVLFVIKDKEDIKTLVFSEQLNTFQSFYNQRNSYISNIQENLYTVNPTIKPNDSTFKIYQYQKGDSSNTPYFVEFISNPNPLNDKIFNVLEFRSDSYLSGELQNFKTFDKLTVSDEYQSNSAELKYTNYGLSTLKKKFRIWKAQIPRDKVKYDRIRNTWTKIKLESTENNDNLNTVLHDITVHYSM